MQYILAAVALSSALPSVVAWGAEGHEAVAYIASNFISSETKTKTQQILNDTTDDWLANVAAWADSYRYTAAGKWSEPLHFIDAQDNPPSACNVNFDRDCGKSGCSISAMVNYTKRVTDESLSAADHAEALRFLVHFAGDIHQPLHDENLEVGGNDIDVSFGSVKTNLHHVWDTNMIEKQNGAPTLPNAQKFAATLTTYIKSGNYTSAAKNWTQGMNIDDPQGSTMIWASDANTFVCSTVMPNGVSSVENKDLSGTYYNGVIPVIDELLARAGYRLAAWLNLIFTGSTGGL